MCLPVTEILSSSGDRSTESLGQIIGAPRILRLYMLNIVVLKVRLVDGDSARGLTIWRGIPDGHAWCTSARESIIAMHTYDSLNRDVIMVLMLASSCFNSVSPWRSADISDSVSESDNSCASQGIFSPATMESPAVVSR